MSEQGPPKTESEGKEKKGSLLAQLGCMNHGLGKKLALVKASYASLRNSDCRFGDSCVHRLQRQEKPELEKCALQQEHKIKVLLLCCIFY